MTRTAIKDHYSESQLFLTRIIAALVVIALMVAVLIGRLVFLQIHSHEHFTTLSEQNRVRVVPDPPTRGLIYDRNGLLLAENLPAYTLVLVPEQVPNFKATLAELRKLIAISDADVNEFRKELRSNRRFQDVPLRYRLSDEEAAIFAVNRHRFPGVDIEARLLRHYPLGSVGVHAVGYVGRISEEELTRLDPTRYLNSDYIGKAGIERYYDELLHGELGVQHVETNAQGRMLRVLERRAPKPGKNLYLHLDARLQAVAESALGDRKGAVVAIDPRTGGVLVLASTPGFDPNLFATGIDSTTYAALHNSEDRPMFNRALRGRYPPGSTIKPFLALAGLEYGITDGKSPRYCRGWYSLPRQEHRYRDWKKEGHGSIDMDLAISQSCDVYFYQLGQELGIQRMHDFMEGFGFNGVTGVDINGELPGLAPSPAWKRKAYKQPWYPGETLIAAIGQGYTLATPIQLASITATLANRGQRWVPRLLQHTEDGPGGAHETLAAVSAPDVHVADRANWERIIKAMVDVVHSPRGTAYSTIGRDAPFIMAGKTGTAQVFTIKQNEKYEKEKVAEKLRDHALFISFSPADAPRIAVAVLVENGGGGSSTAAPVARQIIDYYLGTTP